MRTKIAGSPLFLFLCQVVVRSAISLGSANDKPEGHMLYNKNLLILINDEINA